MSDFWKKLRKTPKERIDDLIEDIKSRARKDDSGDPILYTSNRADRRGRWVSGQRRSRIFGEKMKIPRQK